MVKKPVWAHNDLNSESWLNLEYCSGRDVQSLPMADNELIPYDIWTNQAHCLMLYKCGILKKEEARTLLQALQEIQEKHLQGEFCLRPELEDVHTNIEHYLEKAAGPEFSGKIHTARSRNDQVTCDLRLFLRSKGIHLAIEALYLVQEILHKIPLHINDVMPGITHFQPAITTSFSHFLCSYAQSLLRDIRRLIGFLKDCNINPLGAAASYGTSWTIDRTLTSQYLGFKDIQENSLDCITNRWEFETEFTAVMSLFMTHLSIISQDLILFSSPYLQFCTIDPVFTTGSSIMPQKQNPDFAEVTRAKTAVISGHLQSLFGLSKGMNSGYNRDTQWVKYILQDVIREIGPVFHIFSKVFHSLQTHPQNMLKQCRTGFVNAVDIADYLAREKGMSFRQAYTITGKSIQHDRKNKRLHLNTLNTFLKKETKNIALSEEEFKQLNDYRRLLKLKNSSGGPSPEAVKKSLEKLESTNKKLQEHLDCYEKSIHKAFNHLHSDIQKFLKEK